MPRHLFQVELAGDGDDAWEAWQDAVDSLACDPGTPPVFTIDEEEDDNED